MQKKILLTGATGFLGSHLLESFICNGFEVSILTRSKSRKFRIDFLADQYTSFNIDQLSLNEIFEVVKPDVVVHTACSYGRKNETIFDVLETNLFFALELLKLSEIHHVKSFINTDTLLPKNLNNYSLSKAQFREWLIIYSKSIQVINLRFEHIYGPKDDDSKFIPWLLNQMIFEVGPINLTSGVQKRDFIYITDVVDVFNLIIMKTNILPNWKEFDVGTNNFVKIKEFVLLLANLLEKKYNKNIIPRLNFGSIPSRIGENQTPNLNNKELVELGWNFKINVKEGLNKILLNN